MKIKPRNEFILLETFSITKEQGKILLPGSNKDTQIYKVISGGDNIHNDTLIYLRSQPRLITQGDKTFYLAEAEDIMAMVEL
jgi:co-chaperonin GroES (HSP10)